MAVVLAVLVITLSCATPTREEADPTLTEDNAPTHDQRISHIPIGVGLLTNYGFDVDRPEEGWPRNSDGNPDSPQAVVFSATIVDVTVGS